MTYNELWRKLAQIHEEGEAKAIARMVYEVRFGLSLIDICIGKDTQLSANDQVELEEIAQRLMKQEPVQYVLGQADFCGRTFMVNEHVLIPRPETEELCQWIIAADDSDCNATLSKRELFRTVRVCPLSSAAKILDIGTGSGCIAITLAAEIPNAEVTAWDISEEALDVARENAQRHNVHVTFKQVDALESRGQVHDCFTEANQATCPHDSFDIIVSNPPYICNKEREAMEANVLEHEPHTALFVPDDDPLLFYRAIAEYAQTALTPDGWLYFEINPLYADSLRDMLSKMSYHDIEIREDQFGKQRMIRAMAACGLNDK